MILGPDTRGGQRLCRHQERCQRGERVCGLGPLRLGRQQYELCFRGSWPPRSVPLPLRGRHIRSSSPWGDPPIPCQSACTRSQPPRRLPLGGPSKGDRDPRVPIPLTAAARTGPDGGPEGGVGDWQRPLLLLAEQTSRHQRIQVGRSMSVLSPRGLRAGYTRLAGTIQPPHVARASTGKDPGGPRAAIIRTYLSVGARIGCIDPVLSALFFAEAYSSPTCVGDFSHCMD
ncbi:hypothetical protein NDU88_008325 [Pleurodeles waltl]|uniref:Uncharacterized protein n=1 Tax=Pleurodeles waltl TaxID=8319 RepID=A0AAV7VW44_PLEWA|nr:hypothetical protein NDU88_008325 [Pleurodeles waltl]